MNISKLGVLLGILCALPVMAQSRQDLINKERFGHAWKLPEEFTENRIQTIIQEIVDHTYDVGFRYLGIDEDLFHGHVLFTMDQLTEEGRLYPFAILYHTQEEAYDAHWTDKVSKEFDYINVQTRNWLQWLDTEKRNVEGEVVNARKYLNESRKDPRLFFDVIEPVLKQHFTIHGRDLSPEKMGYGVVGELQFEFYRQDCHKTLDESFYHRGPITVFLPHGEKVCLKLSTSAFIDWTGWLK